MILIPWDDNCLETPDLISEFRRLVRRSARRLQQAEFSRLDSVGFYRSLHPEVRKWPHTLSHSFLFSRIIFRLRSGYCKIGVHTGYAPIEPCPGCGHVLDSIPHFLLECPAYAVHRRLLGNTVATISGRNWISLHLLLSFPPLPAEKLIEISKAVVQYVLNCKRVI